MVYLDANQLNYLALIQRNMDVFDESRLAIAIYFLMLLTFLLRNVRFLCPGFQGVTSSWSG